MSRRQPSTVIDCLPHLRLFASVLCCNEQVEEQVIAQCLRSAKLRLSDVRTEGVLPILLMELAGIIRDNRASLEAMTTDQPPESKDAFLRLPAHHREILLAVDLFGLRYRHAALICACPIGTVKSRVNRARLGYLALKAVPAPAYSTVEGRKSTRLGGSAQQAGDAAS
jgi:hypothetical protein